MAGSGSYFHLVSQGESIESIAASTGHLWTTIWDHVGNRELKQLRKSPHVLLPGDEVFVPPVLLKDETRPTERRHRFEQRGLASRLRVRFEKNGKPRANLGYSLAVDGETTRGTTDQDGAIDVAVSVVVKEITLLFDGDPAEEEYQLLARHLNPVEDLTGIQMRLKNLGYAVGPLDGVVGRSTRAAIAAFQADQGLKSTGTADPSTRDRLVEAHGS
jgi:hypothetical protein